MQLFNQFKDERLITFCQTLFQTMSEIDKSDTTAVSLKANEGNLFTLGAIHTAIDESNQYKEKFNQLMDELKNPNQNQEINSQDTTVYDFVTDAIDRMQFNNK